MTPDQFLKKQALKTQDINISNALIESFVSKSNLIALKVLFYLSYDDSVRLPDSNLITFKIDMKQMCKKINIDQRTLKRSFKVMQETSITFVKEEEYVQDMVILPSIKYMTGTTIIQIDIYRKVLELVKNVKKQYTPIDIKELMKLKSKHSVRMVQLLNYINGFKDKNGKDIPKRKTYNLVQLNGMFGTNYKNLFDFKRKILDRAKTELDNVGAFTFVATVAYDPVLPPRGRPKSQGIVIDLLKNT